MNNIASREDSGSVTWSESSCYPINNEAIESTQFLLHGADRIIHTQKEDRLRRQLEDKQWECQRWKEEAKHYRNEMEVQLVENRKLREMIRVQKEKETERQRIKIKGERIRKITYETMQETQAFVVDLKSELKAMKKKFKKEVNSDIAARLLNEFEREFMKMMMEMIREKQSTSKRTKATQKEERETKVIRNEIRNEMKELIPKCEEELNQHLLRIEMLINEEERHFEKMEDFKLNMIRIFKTRIKSQEESFEIKMTEMRKVMNALQQQYEKTEEERNRLEQQCKILITEDYSVPTVWESFRMQRN